MHDDPVWTGGKDRCEYVSAEDVDAVREAVANYALLLDLIEEYAALIESNTRRARKEAVSTEQKRVRPEKQRRQRQWT